MADEITLTVGFSVRKDKLVYTIPNSTTRHTLAGELYDSGIQEVATSYEALEISGGLSTAGYAHFQNLDDENFVEIGIEESAAFIPLIKLDPGQVAVLPLATLALYAQADTAPVKLQYTIFER